MIIARLIGCGNCNTINCSNFTKTHVISKYFCTNKGTFLTFLKLVRNCSATKKKMCPEKISSVGSVCKHIDVIYGFPTCSNKINKL